MKQATQIKLRNLRRENGEKKKRKKNRERSLRHFKVLIMIPPLP